MVRAGLIRQVGAGSWSWLPAGWRVHQRIVQIVREEMNAIGGQEMLMPVLQPAEPWRRTGRYDDRGAVQAQGPPRRRPGARDDPRGDRHRPRRGGRAVLPRPAADPLPLPDQGARRAAPARRRAADARVHHEGLLHLRPRRRGARGRLPEARRRLRPDDGPLRPGVVPGRGRRRDDGRTRRRTSTWRRARPARTRSCSRPATPPTSRWRAPTPSRSRSPPPLDAPRGRRHARDDDDRRRRQRAEPPGGRPAEGLPGRASTATR